MSETIWLLSQFGGFPLGDFCPPWDDWESREAALAANTAYSRCEPLSPDQFPKRLAEIEKIVEHEDDYIEAGLTPPRADLLPLPPIFYQFGKFIFASEDTAKIFSEFELGRTELHKLGLFARDGKTPHDGFGYWLNMLEVHLCLDPELSERLRNAGRIEIPGKGLVRRWMPLERDDALVLSEPLPDLDLWRDPQLVGSFFVRDPLALALKKQKGGKKLRFVRCKVVEG